MADCDCCQTEECKPVTRTAMCSMQEDMTALSRFMNESATFNDTGTFSTRFGAVIPTFARLILTYNNRFQEWLNSFGYEPTTAFTAGMVMTRTSQTVSYDGERYAPRFDLIPFTTTATFNPTQWRQVTERLPTVDTVLSLDSLTPATGDRVRTRGYLTAYDGGSNHYVYDATGTQAVDGGFVLLGPTGVGRWRALDRNVANVLQFGADGTGNDASAAFQAAIDSGKTVVVPKPSDHYRVKALELRTSLEIDIDEHAQIRGVTDTNPVFVVRTAAVQDVTITGGTFKNLRNVIEASSGHRIKNIRLENSRVQGLTQSGILTDFSDGIKMVGVIGSLNKAPMVQHTGVNSMTDVLFDRCRWSDNTNPAARLIESNGDQANNVAVRNSHFSDNQCDTLMVFSGGSKNVTFKGNYLENSARDYVIEMIEGSDGSLRNTIVEHNEFGAHDNLKSYVRCVGDVGATIRENAFLNMRTFTNIKTDAHGNHSRPSNQVLTRAKTGTAGGTLGQRIVEIVGNSTYTINCERNAIFRNGNQSDNDFDSTFDIRGGTPGIEFTPESSGKENSGLMAIDFAATIAANANKVQFWPQQAKVFTMTATQSFTLEMINAPEGTERTMVLTIGTANIPIAFATGSTLTNGPLNKTANAVNRLRFERHGGHTYITIV